MALPAARVTALEERAVVVCLPGETGGCGSSAPSATAIAPFTSRGGWRRCCRRIPRGKVLEVVRLRAAKGFLVPPGLGIPELDGVPAPDAEPERVSAPA